jgi:hypothetical protein
MFRTPAQSSPLSDPDNTLHQPALVAGADSFDLVSPEASSPGTLTCLPSNEDTPEAAKLERARAAARILAKGAVRAAMAAKGAPTTAEAAGVPFTTDVPG